MNEHEILEHDLDVLRAMVEHVDAYLMSEATQWDMGKPDMPLMSLGGILMRLHRLPALRSLLSETEQVQLDEAAARFDQSLVEKVVRFEERAHAELHARLREWTNYLRDLPGRRESAPAHYAGLADTRVVISALADKLRQPPYRLEAHIPADIAALDRRLCTLWEPGPFIWSPVWEPAYPPDRFPWLYGHPKAG